MPSDFYTAPGRPAPQPDDGRGLSTRPVETFIISTGRNLSTQKIQHPHGFLTPPAPCRTAGGSLGGRQCRTCTARRSRTRLPTASGRTTAGCVSAPLRVASSHGAGDGNRTHMAGLEGRGSAVELRPHAKVQGSRPRLRRLTTLNFGLGTLTLSCVGGEGWIRTTEG